MTAVTSSIGVANVDVYSLPEVGRNARNLEIQTHRHAVHAPSPTAPGFGSHPWTVEESPLSVEAPAMPFRRSPTWKSSWLADALQALAEVDDEIAEDSLPKIGPSTKKEAERVIVALARHPRAPAVYPTQDGEIAIHFRSLGRPGSVVILLDTHGRGECYAYTGGHNRRAHYDVSSDLPDAFVLEQLRALTPERTADSAQPEGLGTSVMMLQASMPTGR